MTKSLAVRVMAVVSAVLFAGALIVQTVSGEKKESVSSRLQKLEDREAIRQLLMNYGRYLDQRDFASFSGLFAEKDGEWIGGMGKAKSRDSIRKLMESTIGSDTTGSINGPNCHVFTNEVIQVDGNQATAVTKWIFVVQNSSKQPQPFYIGHYEDTLKRESGQWKFLRRVVYGDIPPDDPLSRK
jgi:hypothetical protein